MMAWTDVHCRAVHRLLAPHARLYTEMVSTGALLNGPRDRLLHCPSDQHPLALQLGGSCPDALAACCRLAAEAGFDEINLNLGCPSDRVQQARFGACLMIEPEQVAECVRAMARASEVPVTVKCRLGVDDHDSYAFLEHFVDAIAEAGARTVIVHARKAWLTGLTPAENRSIPPLDYERVYRLKAARASLSIVLNGGLADLDAILEHAERLDGVMIGRAAYHDPWLLARADAALFGTPLPSSRHAALAPILSYVDTHLAAGGRLHDVTRHLHGYFNGCRGARRFRRHLATHAPCRSAGRSVLEDAASLVVEAVPPETRCSID
jgi:tRNA-dihydrouridine synthase A